FCGGSGWFSAVVLRGVWSLSGVCCFLGGRLKRGEDGEGVLRPKMVGNKGRGREEDRGKAAAVMVGVWVR
ncbi:hypothetical protein HAX54_034826, partial [Datura stramonium]|nr:hypothetical protein [Datura stramonium]